MQLVPCLRRKDTLAPPLFCSEKSSLLTGSGHEEHLDFKSNPPPKKKNLQVSGEGDVAFILITAKRDRYQYHIEILFKSLPLDVDKD